LEDVFNKITGPIEMNVTHLEELRKMFSKLVGVGSNILPVMATRRTTDHIAAR
jgi:hypothetical protein